MNLTIRKAFHDDLPQIGQLVADCVSTLRAAGIDQWDEANPSAETLRADVAAGAVEVLYDNGELVGSVTMDHAVDPLWKNWDWSTGGEPAVSLHRLMAHPSRRGRGFGQLLMQHAEDLTRHRGGRSIRLDCLLKNTDAVAFYKHLGFRQTGTADGRKGKIAGFEKLLTSSTPEFEMNYRFASEADCSLLAEWNHQLIRDEGHRNSMTLDQLTHRMAAWLSGDYRAVIFSTDRPVAYALYRDQSEQIHLRQFFVALDHRRCGIGSRALQQLKTEVWPVSVRLTVDVLCANTAGIAFWRAVGYRDYCLTLEIMP